ncbi:DUF885 domain-containing protein [Ferrimonas aestuarii]|uniref:DUF885 domain-containing protein n=1 Tax=Ferrimonas aestuarii TaxID=2569539 RepID=UPI001E581FBE|nr:DUF885 domain-containing protein [Ferrimonas aestuarii]
MTLRHSITAAAVSATLLFSQSAFAHAEGHGQPAPTSTTSQAKQSDNAAAEALFEQFFMEDVMASPVFQTYLGIKKDQDKWDDLSDGYQQQQLERTKAQLSKLSNLDESALSGQTKLSYQLLKQQLEQDIADYKWRYHSYPVNQMYGYQSTTPSFLINQHQIESVDDATAYISRLEGIEKRFDQVISQLKTREQRGIIAPKFVFAYVLDDSRNIITGYPFEDSEQPSTLWQDFSDKVAKLELTQQAEQALLNDAQMALTGPVKRGYDKLIKESERLQSKASTDDGAWKFPDGDAFYNQALKNTTTTEMTADEIHKLGLSEVARIHDEMRAIMNQVGFKGDLQAFFEFMRTDKQFILPDTEAGKQQYLQLASDYIGNMNAQLDSVFGIKPQAGLEVKQVEAFREKSAGKAFYQRPAPDGSRPGFFYANLYQMADMPTYQLEALAFHEGIPGHHMQIAIAQELDSLPKFRRFGGYTAYIEGWGLYSEYLPKEMGFYQDPYSDFGRLAMELWRACRLVVDTGIHAKRWTREQAIDYLAKNTPNPEGDIVKAIERYIVMPSQATAYKVGMIKILELREQAKQQLGDQFELKGFHDTVLGNGPLPLNVLEQQVNNWVDSVRL